jgi:predicted regulator of amino acid metabolism with ACT domain
VEILEINGGHKRTKMDRSVAKELVEELLEDEDRIRSFEGVETDKLMMVLSVATEMGYKVLVWSDPTHRWVIKIQR